MTFRYITMALCMFFIPQLVYAQVSPSDLWVEQHRNTTTANQIKSVTYQLNHGMLERIIAASPVEGAVARGKGARLSLPTPNGDYLSFRIEQSTVMAPELASKFPNIETFRGQSIEEPAVSVRFSRTALGFQATVVGPDGVFLVAPKSRNNTSNYVVTKVDGTMDVMFQCLVDSFTPSASGAIDFGSIAALDIAPSGDVLSSYRLAVAATGEYTQFLGGTQALALAGIATVINGVNAIYEVEFAVRLILVANNENIVYTDSDTDPFPLGNKNAETQAAIDSEIGEAQYDIGHLFHKEGASISGNAGCIACVCEGGSKGSGWSQGPDPTNGNFLFVVAHEMGHQHGGSHTFNGTGCPAGAYSASSSWEPGSGTTIMSYSSICGVDNILGNQVGGLYFHAGSRQQITSYILTGAGSSCGTTDNTGNTIPTINAGADYTIPRSTPFELTASANDIDGDSLTYTWEQFDLGPRSALNTVDDGSIPLFRSFPSSSNATRTFPNFQDLLGGVASLFPNKLGEQLPSTERVLTFRATVRDNSAGGAGVNDDEIILTVAGDPFAITSPNASEELECNAPSDILWDVGGGNVVDNVDVLFSSDGGNSFPFTLAANKFNDGVLVVTGPDTLTQNGRVRLNAVDNVFFTLSEQIAVEDTLEPTVFCPANVVAECTGNNGINKADTSLVAFFEGASVTDACDLSVPMPVDDSPAFLPLGIHSITFSSTDASGNTGSCLANIDVADTLPPTISVSLTPDKLFPSPNHKMRRVLAKVTVDDTCDPNPAIELTSITSNEPDDGIGDGNTEADIDDADFGTEDYSFLLRAERSGNGSGRIYTVTYTVTDGTGNTTSTSASVTVQLSARSK